MERLSLLLFVSYSRWRGSSAFPVRVARNVVYCHWLSLLLGYRCVGSRVKLSWLFQLRLFNCAWRKCDNLSFTGSSQKEMRARAPVAVTESLLSTCFLLTLYWKFDWKNLLGKQAEVGLVHPNWLYGYAVLFKTHPTTHASVTKFSSRGQLTQQVIDRADPNIRCSVTLHRTEHALTIQKQMSHGMALPRC